MYPLLLLLAFVPSSSTIAAASDDDSCRVVSIVPERWPSLTVPRSGHTIFYAHGELTVTGGHTTHFVPTMTAEYLSDGEWHPVQMAYTHDNGFAVVLRSGEVLIGGGHDEELGIDQTFTLERYTPQTHISEGFGCLDRRRVLSSALQLSDGRVIIAGNHYANDAIACYDHQSQIQELKQVVQGRSNPYLLRTADDDVIIIGAYNTRDHMPDSVWADRLKGDAFRVPLLEQWRLVYTDQPFNSDHCATEDGTYLLTASDSNGQLGIVTVRDTCFSLLPTACPIPMKSPFGDIDYKGIIVTDKQRQRGYLIGIDDSLRNRQYILAIDYARQPASLTLYHTPPIAHSTITIPIVTPNGDLILAGGIVKDNYTPLADVWCYHFGTPMPDALAQDQGKGLPTWLWVLFAVALLAALIYLYNVYRRKGMEARHPTNASSQLSDDELLQRICQLLKERQLYLRSKLKPSDVAIELDVRASRLADCLSATRGITFAQLLGEYRVHYAQQLLREQPTMKIVAVASESGFTSESTFFRTFKAVTGLAPREWLNTLGQDADCLCDGT